MSYHVEKTNFKKLPDKIIVREDGYLGEYKYYGKPIIDYIYQPVAVKSNEDMLTAEQVRKAVEGHGNIMDNKLYEDWQAVADELNATLSSGTCK